MVARWYLALRDCQMIWLFLCLCSLHNLVPIPFLNTKLTIWLSFIIMSKYKCLPPPSPNCLTKLIMKTINFTFCPEKYDVGSFFYHLVNLSQIRFLSILAMCKDQVIGCNLHRNPCSSHIHQWLLKIHLKWDRLNHLCFILESL